MKIEGDRATPTIPSLSASPLHHHVPPQALTKPLPPRRHEAVAPPRGLTAALVGLGLKA